MTAKIAGADERRMYVTIDDEFLPDRSVRIPVELAGHPVYVEAVLVRRGEDEEVASRVPSFDEFTAALGSVTRSVTEAVFSGLGKVKPAKVGVEFGCEVGLESGQLTAILVKGTAKANVKVTLEWKSGGDA